MRLTQLYNFMAWPDAIPHYRLKIGAKFRSCFDQLDNIPGFSSQIYERNNMGKFETHPRFGKYAVLPIFSGNDDENL